jgi:RimJ/RimL family protein N-acetyltransferase
MIRFVYDHDAEIGAFVASRMPNMSRGFGSAIKTIGVINERNEFLLGAVYHQWTPEAETIGMSMAATTPRWASRQVLHRILDFPFNECGCQMLLAQVRSSDFRTQRQLAAAGFAFVTISRLYGRDQDGIIASLTDDDWRVSKFNRPPVEPKLEEAA